MEEIYHYLARGGVIMIPIGICSLVGLAVFLERFWFLRQERIIPGDFLKKFYNLIEKKKYSEAIVLCQENGSPIAMVLSVGVKHINQPRSIVRESIEDTGRHESAHLERYINVIGIVASISPLLGLLGTVTGMIRVFQKVVTSAKFGAVDPSRLASGIWEALLTTAAGLAVGIPALVGYRYLLSKVQTLALEMEKSSLKFIEIISNKEVK
jgi:biopolymer transport protein ExbB